MDFLHCNACMQGPPALKQFFLTACTHVFCRPCCEKMKIPEKSEITCQQCKKQSRIIEIGPNMPSKARELFMPVERLIADKIKKNDAAFKWQEEQMQSLREFSQQARDRLIEAKKAEHHDKAKIAELSEKYNTLLNGMQYYQAQLKEAQDMRAMLEQQLAASNAAPLPLINSSMISEVPSSLNMSFGNFFDDIPASAPQAMLPPRSPGDLLANSAFVTPSAQNSSRHDLSFSSGSSSQATDSSLLNTPKLLGVKKSNVRSDNPYVANWNAASVERQKRVAAVAHQSASRSRPGHSPGSAIGSGRPTPVAMGGNRHQAPTTPISHPFSGDMNDPLSIITQGSAQRRPPTRETPARVIPASNTPKQFFGF